MKIKTESGTFAVPKNKEGYVLFTYPVGGGAFHISYEDGEVEVYIPRKVIQQKRNFFEIQGGE